MNNAARASVLARGARAYVNDVWFRMFLVCCLTRSVFAFCVAVAGRQWQTPAHAHGLDFLVLCLGRAYKRSFHPFKILIPVSSQTDWLAGLFGRPRYKYFN